MAYIVELRRPCHVTGCEESATCEVRGGHGRVYGRYCSRHVREGVEKWNAYEQQKDELRRLAEERGVPFGGEAL